MASTKAKGSTKNNRDSRSQRLGVKVFGGSTVKKGMIIVRQRGSKFYAGAGVKVGGDDTVFAVKDGIVTFQWRRVRTHAGRLLTKTEVSVA